MNFSCKKKPSIGGGGTLMYMSKFIPSMESNSQSMSGDVHSVNQNFVFHQMMQQYFINLGDTTMESNWNIQQAFENDANTKVETFLCPDKS